MRLRLGPRAFQARILTAALLCLAAIMLLSVQGFAQAISGDLLGAVTDPTGAVVANGTVEATNLATQLKLTTKTNASGEYHFVNLPVGHYSLRVTAGGLSGGIKDIEVILNQKATANITARVSGETTSVEVSAQTVTVDTTTPQIQNTFGVQQLQDLPLGAGAVNSGLLNLSLLNAGVATQGGIALGSGPSISGQRPRNNNFTVEGVDNNRKDITGPNLQIPNDAVENFTVLQNQFAPEYGHSSGGQFNQTIRSGTNSFHGSLYEYFQNRNLNAQESLTATAQRSNGTRPSNPRYDQNRLGGSFGGPIKKDKLFFFSLFEYNPLGQSLVAPTACVPTAAGYATLAATPGVNQTNVQQFQKYAGTAGAPAPANDANCLPSTTVNGATVAIGDIGYPASYFQNIYTIVNSVDYNISEKDQLRARYSYERQNTLDITAQIGTFFQSAPIRYHLFTLGEYHQFSPSLSNEFRLGYNRFAQTIPAGDFQFPGLGTFPNLIVGFGEGAGVQIGPNPNAPQFTFFNTYQAVDNLSWVKGKHNFKFGVEYREYIAPQGFTQRVRGDYDYTTFQGYFADQVPDFLAERSIGNETYYGNQKAIYGYVADDFRVTHNLTLNLGVRYEWTEVPLSEREWQPLNAISNVPGLISFGEPQSQKKNFAPRVGFAYSPGSSGNTAIRGGFSMAYDVLYDNLGILSAPPQKQQTCDATPGDQSALTSTCFWKDPTLGQNGFLASGGLPFAPTVPPITDPAVARAATGGFIPDQKLPYSETWTLGVQHTFADKYVAEVRYVGTRGIHLPMQIRLNRQAKTSPTLFLPTFLTMPDAATIAGLTTTFNQIDARSSFVPAYAAAGFTGANVTAFEPFGWSQYHGLQTQVSRRFSDGLQFQLAWTWSHNIDNSTADVFSTYITPRRPEDFQCPSCDRSTSALDRRHRVTAQIIYDLPLFKGSSGWVKNLLGGWQVAPVFTWQSPEQATVQSAADVNGNGDTAGDRVYFNPNGIPGTGTGTTAITNAAGNVVGYVANDPTAQYIALGKYARPNTTRNTLALPYIKNLDLSVGKTFKISERQAVKFQFQAVNALNTAQYVPGYIGDIAPVAAGFIGANILNTLVPGNPGFNQPSSVYTNHPRQVVLALRYTF